MSRTILRLFSNDIAMPITPVMSTAVLYISKFLTKWLPVA